MKKFFKILGYVFLSIISLLVALYLFDELFNQYNYNHKYSIAMPNIMGEFQIEDNYIKIYGLKNIIDNQTATLTYSELQCLPTFSDKPCTEQYIVITGLGNQISIFPHYEEYNIKYMDKNKIIFKNALDDISGEIDLNSKTLIYTTKGTLFNKDKIRKIEVITDNKKIEELEKQIIRKYLKIKPFRR